METQEIPKKNREFYNRPWFWIIVGVVVLVAIGSSNNSGSGNAGSNAQDSAPATVTAAPEQKATTPAPVVKVTPVKSSAPTPSSQPTYTTPSGATVNNSGSVVAPPPAPPASWHTVATFSGSADTNTNDFAIKGSKWRIDWSFSFPTNNASYCQQYGCNMAVQVFQDDSTYVDQFLQEGQQPGSGTVYEYGKPTGNMYLHVVGGNVSWTLTVEDYY